MSMMSDVTHSANRGGSKLTAPTGGIEGVVIREGRMTINSAMAREILEHQNYAKQRPMKERNYARLMEEMRRGKWIEGTNISFCEFAGEMFLVNGQHRLAVIADSGRSSEFVVSIHKVNTKDEIGRHYALYDQPESVRTVSQVASALGVFDMVSDKVPYRLTEAAFKAMPYLATGLELWRPQDLPPHVSSQDAKRDYLREWVPALELYSADLGAQKAAVHNKFRTAGVMLVALPTYRYNRQMASDFWTRAMSGEMMQVGDTRLTLNQFYLQNSLPTPFMTAAAASIAWNAFAIDRKLSQIRLPKHPQKIYIMHTPYQR